MKILVYQPLTEGNNLGDIAMLEGVIRRLLHITDNIQLCVCYIPRLPEEVWKWKNVTPAPLERFSDSNAWLSYIKKIPYLRRYIRFSDMLPGHDINLSQIQVGASPDSPTLEDWCRDYDALHIVGMGGLTDQFPDVSWHFRCLSHAFTSQNKPIILTGQQIGPFFSKSTTHLVQKAMRNAAFVGLREPTDSLLFCQQAQLKSENFALMGDDTFGLPAADFEQVQSFLAQYDLSPKQFLAVNVRIAGYAGSSEKYIQQISQLLSNLSRRYDLPIVVVPIALDEYDSDITSGYLLAERMGHDRIKVLDKPNELSATLIKGVLGQAYAVVGVSYHSCIFALSQGVPAICIFDGDYYSQKARGIASFWGDERLALPLNKLNVEQATAQIAGLIEDQQFREALQTRAEVALKEWQIIFDRAVEKMLAHHQTNYVSSCYSS